MKTKSILLALTAGLLMAVSACGPKGMSKEEQARQDSIRMADSIAREQALLEQVRQDSLRHDSIAKVMKIKNAMPTVKMFGENLQDPDGGELIYVDELRKNLVALGYEKINANKFVLNPGGDPNVTVKLNYQDFEGEYDEEFDDYVGGGFSYSIDIIFSDEEDAKAFYKKWKAARKTSWVSEDRSGKKVTLMTYGD